MANDSSLGLLFQIDADPSKATAAIAGFSATASAQVKELQAAVVDSAAKIGAGTAAGFNVAGLSADALKAKLVQLQGELKSLQELGSGSTGLSSGLSAEISKVQSQIAAVETQLGSMGEAGQIAGGAIAEGAKTAEYSLTKARVAAQGLGDELGLRMPRVLTTMIAESPVLGAALSSAFSIIGIGLFVEILTRVPGEIQNVIDALGGWDEAAKKAYADEIALNEKAITDLRELAKEKRAVAEIGLTGPALEEQKARDQAAGFRDDAAAAADLQQRINRLTEENKKLKDSLGQPGTFSQIVSGIVPAAGAISGLTNLFDGATEKIKENDAQLKILGDELNALSGPGGTLTKAGVETAKTAAEVAAAQDKAAAADEKAAEAAWKHAQALKDLQATLREIDNYKPPGMKKSGILEAQLEEDKTLQDEKNSLYAALLKSQEEWSKKSLAALVKSALDSLKERNAELKSEKSLQKQEEEALRRHETVKATLLKQELAALRAGQTERAQYIADEIQQLQEVQSKYEQLGNTISQFGSTISSVLKAAGDASQAAAVAQIASAVAVAIVKVEVQVAAGLASLAVGDDWGAAMHFASAAEYAIVAGSQVAQAAGAGGNGSGLTKSAVQSAVAPGTGPAQVSNAPIAAGAKPANPSSPAGGVTVMVAGPTKAAQWMAGVLNDAVQNNSLRLVSSHTMRPAPAVRSGS